MKARDTELREMAAIGDLRFSTNQNMIIQSNHSQLVQISMMTTNVLIEDPNLLVNWDPDLTRHRHKQSTANVTNRNDKRRDKF